MLVMVASNEDSSFGVNHTAIVVVVLMSCFACERSTIGTFKMCFEGK